MKKHIEKLKSKPDHHKQKIAQTLAFITTGVIVVIYFIILALRPQIAPQDNQPESSGPTLGESIQTIFTNSAAELAEVKQEFDKQPSISEIIEQAQQEELAQEKDILTESALENYGEPTITTE